MHADVHTGTGADPAEHDSHDSKLRRVPSYIFSTSMSNTSDDDEFHDFLSADEHESPRRDVFPQGRRRFLSVDVGGPPPVSPGAPQRTTSEIKMKKLLRSWPAKDQGGAGALSGEADAPAGLQAQFPNVLSPRGTGSSLTRWSDLDSKPAGMHDAEAQHDADATPQARTDSKRLTPPAQHNAAHHRKRLERTFSWRKHCSCGAVCFSSHSQLAYFLMNYRNCIIPTIIMVTLLTTSIVFHASPCPSNPQLGVAALSANALGLLLLMLGVASGRTIYEFSQLAMRCTRISLRERGRGSCPGEQQVAHCSVKVGMLLFTITGVRLAVWSYDSELDDCGRDVKLNAIVSASWMLGVVCCAICGACVVLGRDYVNM